MQENVLVCRKHEMPRWTGIQAMTRSQVGKNKRLWTLFPMYLLDQPSFTELTAHLTFIPLAFNIKASRVQRNGQNFYQLLLHSGLLSEETCQERAQQNGILVTPSDVTYLLPTFSGGNMSKGLDRQ